MFLSVVLYAGAVLLMGSLLLLLQRRTRRIAWRTATIGLLLVVIAFVWPVSETQVATRETHLDEAMPVWQFNERHATHIAASPERVFEAIHAVTPDEILFFRTLTTIRRLGRPAPANILNAPKREPLLDLATRTSFKYVANDPPRELVVVTRVAPNTLATMNFLVRPDGSGGSLLSTETRVFAENPAAERGFAVYWRIIHPGSAIIRRMWLRAIKRRAES